MPVRRDHTAHPLRITIDMDGDFTREQAKHLAVEVCVDRVPCELTVDEYLILFGTLEEVKMRLREFVVQ